MDNMDGKDRMTEIIEQVDKHTLVIHAVRDMTDEEVVEVFARAAAFIKSHTESSVFSSEDSTENQSRAVEY